MKRGPFRIIFLIILLSAGFGLRLFSLTPLHVSTPEEILDQAIEKFEENQDDLFFKRLGEINIADPDIYFRRDNQRRNSTRQSKPSGISTIPVGFFFKIVLFSNAGDYIYTQLTDHPPKPAYYTFIFRYRPF